MSKVKEKIKRMEQQCMNNVTTEKCALIKCKNCNLNKKYKDLVGLGMEEMIYWDGE